MWVRTLARTVVMGRYGCMKHNYRLIILFHAPITSHLNRTSYKKSGRTKCVHIMEGAKINALAIVGR
jgi:hypothetical protein